jgi:hypothetical protein
VVARDRIAPVDLAPDGGHATRRVLRLNKCATGPVHEGAAAVTS